MSHEVCRMSERKRKRPRDGRWGWIFRSFEGNRNLRSSIKLALLIFNALHWARLQINNWNQVPHSNCGLAPIPSWSGYGCLLPPTTLGVKDLLLFAVFRSIDDLGFLRKIFSWENEAGWCKGLSSPWLYLLLGQPSNSQTLGTWMPPGMKHVN
jgi:hypothetical protein